MPKAGTPSFDIEGRGAHRAIRPLAGVRPSVDQRDGRTVSVNADVPEMQVVSVGIPDMQASALGGKGVGEIGVVGVAPAIGNAVFHATGKRV